MTLSASPTSHLAQAASRFALSSHMSGIDLTHGYRISYKLHDSTHYDGSRQMPLMATDHDGTSSEIFWGEIAPCEHMVQIYGEDSAFLDALEGFTAGGLRGDEGVVVIAMPAHLA